MASIYLWAWHAVFNVFWEYLLRYASDTNFDLLLGTTRRIHRTHSNFGGSSPLRGGSAFMFFVSLSSFVCARLQTKRVDLQIFRQDVRVNSHVNSQRAMTFSAGGDVVAWGLDFGAKFPPMKCMAKFVTTHIYAS